MEEFGRSIGEFLKYLWDGFGDALNRFSLPSNVVLAIFIAVIIFFILSRIIRAIKR